jgi:ribosomal protein L7/L12
LILLTLLYRRQEIDTTDLPEPSAEVRRICEDPNSTLAKAVKAYRDETGLGLAEATAVLKAYLTKLNNPCEQP